MTFQSDILYECNVCTGSFSPLVYAWSIRIIDLEHMCSEILTTVGLGPRMLRIMESRFLMLFEAHILTCLPFIVNFLYSFQNFGL